MMVETHVLPVKEIVRLVLVQQIIALHVPLVSHYIFQLEVHVLVVLVNISHRQVYVLEIQQTVKLTLM
jgi:hypothetical protein